MKRDPGWEGSGPTSAGVAAVGTAVAAGPVTESVRYQSLYIPFDNSAHALRAVELGIAIARETGACVTASHVYAAGLHDRRFRQMESGLPERYREEAKLAEQREVHDELITRGLGLISECYLDVVGERSVEAQVPFRRVALEGKNWRKLVEDIRGSDHDLVIMGALGLGAVACSLVGSVCERVARRIDRDLLVVRTGPAQRPGAIVVGVDGSAHAYGALKAALALARVFNRPVEAVAVYDPFFHRAAFHGIAGVLSPAAASVFRFREQERLHEEIIDGGLAKIYQAHLAVAAKIAGAEGVALRTRLLAGKAFEQILNYAREREPWLLAVGRIGAHSDAAVDLGSTTENLLRSAPCHLLLAARAFEPAVEQVADVSIAWTREAEARMQRVPEFARGVARRAVVMHAAAHGHTVITSDVIDECLATVAPGEPWHDVPPNAAKCPFAHRARNVSRRGSKTPAKNEDGGRA